MKDIEIIGTQGNEFEDINIAVGPTAAPRCDSWKDCQPYCYWPYSVYSAGLGLHFDPAN
jgi:hypothetical protein